MRRRSRDLCSSSLLQFGASAPRIPMAPVFRPVNNAREAVRRYAERSEASHTLQRCRALRMRFLAPARNDRQWRNLFPSRPPFCTGSFPRRKIRPRAVAHVLESQTHSYCADSSRPRQVARSTLRALAILRQSARLEGRLTIYHDARARRRIAGGAFFSAGRPIGTSAKGTIWGGVPRSFRNASTRSSSG